MITRSLAHRPHADRDRLTLPGRLKRESQSRPHAQPATHREPRAHRAPLSSRATEQAGTGSSRQRNMFARKAVVAREFGRRSRCVSPPGSAGVDLLAAQQSWPDRGDARRERLKNVPSPHVCPRRGTSRWRTSTVSRARGAAPVGLAQADSAITSRIGAESLARRPSDAALASSTRSAQYRWPASAALGRRGSASSNSTKGFRARSAGSTGSGTRLVGQQARVPPPAAAAPAYVADQPGPARQVWL